MMKSWKKSRWNLKKKWNSHVYLSIYVISFFIQFKHFSVNLFKHEYLQKKKRKKMRRKKSYRNDWYDLDTDVYNTITALISIYKKKFFFFIEQSWKIHLIIRWRVNGRRFDFTARVLSTNYNPMIVVLMMRNERDDDWRKRFACLAHIDTLRTHGNAREYFKRSRQLFVAVHRFAFE